MYTMEETSEIADKGTEHITQYLKSFSEIIEVINVENNKDYQEKDIDLLVVKKEDLKEKVVRIEIKVDRYHTTGNFFFETVSNTLKETNGCFMYSEADLLFYYFINIQKLYILPMKETRDWFIENVDRFKEKRCTSSVGNGGSYASIGRAVPRKVVLDEVEGAVLVDLTDYLDIEVEYE